MWQTLRCLRNFFLSNILKGCNFTKMRLESTHVLLIILHDFQNYTSFNTSLVKHLSAVAVSSSIVSVSFFSLSAEAVCLKSSAKNQFWKILLNLRKSTRAIVTLFNKVVGCSLATIIKNETSTLLFYCKFCEIFNNSLLIKHLWKGASVVYCIQSMI